jgi:hypothetical protein
LANVPACIVCQLLPLADNRKWSSGGKIQAMAATDTLARFAGFILIPTSFATGKDTPARLGPPEQWLPEAIKRKRTRETC